MNPKESSVAMITQKANQAPGGIFTFLYINSISFHPLCYN